MHVPMQLACLKAFINIVDRLHASRVCIASLSACAVTYSRNQEACLQMGRHAEESIQDNTPNRNAASWAILEGHKRFLTSFCCALLLQDLVQHLLQPNGMAGVRAGAQSDKMIC